MASSIMRGGGRAALRGATRVGQHLFPEALITGGKKAGMGAGKAWGGEEIQNQLRMYDRDVIDPGMEMMPEFLKTENEYGKIASELGGEQLGLLKYIQDKTIQPWMDLGYDGYKQLRDWDGKITQAPRPRPSRTGHRVSEEDQVPKGLL